MPTRAVALARATDIPPDVYVAIARDPKAFDAKLAEWDKRRTDAQKAEGIARERKAEAERAEERSQGQLEELADRARQVGEDRDALDAQMGEATARSQELDDRDASLTARAAELDAQAAEVGAMRDQAIAAVKALLD